MEKFRERLTEILETNKINQSELARQLNIERQGITNYKNGNSIPSLDTFKNLCLYLDVSADYLLGIEELDGRRIDNRTFQFNNINNINIK